MFLSKCFLLFMFYVYLCYAILSVPSGKGLTSLLSCVLCFLVVCHYPICYAWSAVVLDCIHS